MIGAIGHAACGIASRAYSSHCGHVGNQARRDETCTVSQLFHGPAPRSLIRRLAIRLTPLPRRSGMCRAPRHTDSDTQKSCTTTTQNLLTVYDDGCRYLLTTEGCAWVGPSGSTR